MNKRPANYGIHLPVELVKVRDGDTLVVRRRGGGLDWPVRLLDCWAPERNTKEGRAATAYMHTLVEGKELSLWVPFERIENSVLDLFTFDRVLGHVYTDDGDLSALMREAGHADKYKDGN